MERSGALMISNIFFITQLVIVVIDVREAFVKDDS